MPGRAAVCRPANFCFLLFGEPFWNGGGLRKTRSQLRLNFLLLFPARKRLFGTGLKELCLGSDPQNIRPPFDTVYIYIL